MTGSELGVGPDPDPTPTATPWQEYLAAAQSLDAVGREAAAASRTTGPVRAEHARVQERLDQQRARLVGEAVQARLPAPPLVPTPAEQAAAHAQLAGDPAAAADALRQCEHLLQRADAQLADAQRAEARPAGVQRAGVQPAATRLSDPPLTGGQLAMSAPTAGPPTGGLPTGGLPTAGPPAPARPAGRGSWSPPVWLMIVAPLGTATLALFAITILLAVLR